MDPRTLKDYDCRAKELSIAHAAQAPEHLYQLAQQYFQVGGLTADIGCGHGRDTRWLSDHGFPTKGYDGSQGMILEAKARFTELTFEIDPLPELKSIQSQTFENVFCCAVLMHIPKSQIEVAIKNLLRVTKPSGTLIISVRDSATADNREGERLYECYDLQELERSFLSFGSSILQSSRNQDVHRPGIHWSTLVLRKNA